MNLTKNLKLMSLGIDCKFLKIKEREKAPVDNILCLNSSYIDSLFDFTYKDKFLSGGELIEDHKYFIKSLGLLILHNNYDDHYIEQHLIRLNNFYNFLSNINRNDYYFILNLARLDFQVNIEDFRLALIKYNILKKTIVFGDKSYQDKFINFIPVINQINGQAESFFKAEYSILQNFNNFTVSDMDFLKSFS